MEARAPLMDQAAVRRSLIRMTHEIIEKNKGTERLCLVGVKRRGVSIANILAEYLKKFDGADVPLASIDVTMYRDDRKKHEMTVSDEKQGIALPFDVTGKTVILVDDVIYTGRTVRAAIEAIFSCGRPSAIQLAVLIDRGHRELPIRPDFVGKNIPTSKDEIVTVLMDDYDGETAVRICKK